MSIANEITRLQNAKASIKTSIENKGVTVPSIAKLDDYSLLIDDIPSGGGKFSFLNGGGINFYGDSRSNLQTDLENIIDNMDTSTIKNMTFCFSACSSLTSLNLSGFDLSNVVSLQGLCQADTALTSATMPQSPLNYGTNYSQMFYNCSYLTTLDLRFLAGNNNGYITTNMFRGCSRLQKLDIRNMDLTKITTYTNMFGQYTSDFPSNCEIIVKDAAQKQWLNTNFSRLTNVKIASEL